MEPAARKPSAKREADQFETRGYIITEDADLALKDVALGLDALASLCEERTGDMPEIPPSQWAGLIRTFSRQAKAIYDDAAFANRASATKRDLH